jgi:uncharacterized protein YdeI (YjbR/CyaY-like superfamily)
LAAIETLQRVECRTRAEWRRWLKANHRQRDSIWLVTFKKNSGQPALRYEEAVEEALCFGWIDSRPAKLDEQRRMLLFSPRKPRSVWARTNKERVERLIRDGLMTPAGLETIERAKRDGSWTVLDDVEEGLVPADLEAALASDPDARAKWEAFTDSGRKQTLQWLKMAKTAATREKRIAEIVRLAALGLRPNQSRPKT